MKRRGGRALGGGMIRSEAGGECGVWKRTDMVREESGIIEMRHGMTEWESRANSFVSDGQGNEKGRGGFVIHRGRAGL